MIQNKNENKQTNKTSHCSLLEDARKSNYYFENWQNEKKRKEGNKQVNQIFVPP